MKKSFICLLLTIFYIASCTQPVVEVFGSISGYVVDEDSGAAIGGARVTLTPTGSSQVTSTDGEFLFDNLDAQEYTLSIKKDGYKDLSQKVSVKAGVTSSVQVAMSPIQPVLKVEPEVLDFGGEATSLALDITNSGKGTLEWTIDEEIKWITCSAASGETTDKVASVVVKASREGMEKGSYTETIVISSNGGSAIVKVKMSVGSAIKLSVNPDELDFGTAESQIQVTIINNGEKAVQYTASTANNWLTLDKASSSVHTTDYINAIVSREGLDAGPYTSSITLSTDGGDIIIPVKMTVAHKCAPTVTAESVEDITYNSAFVNGTIVDIGSSKITRHGFCYSSSNKQPSVDDNVANLGDCSAPKAFKGVITNLGNMTTYYVRAFAENQEGISYSSTLSFTTSDLPKLAEVETGEVTEITAKTAVATGVIKHLGNMSTLTAHGHVWNTTGNPSLSTGNSTDLGECSEATVFTSELTGLKGGTTYYVRAYATNEKGTAYGEEVTFTTSDLRKLAEVETGEVTEITAQTAVTTGVIKHLGNVSTLTAHGHVWNTAGNPSLSSGNSTDLGECSEATVFTSELTGLEGGTTYYVRAYATNEKGTAYGEEVTFTTEKAPVELGDIIISDVTRSSATVTAELLSEAGHTIVEKGFCYYKDGTEDYMFAEADKNFTATLTGLESKTKYWVSAYVVNSEDKSFWTEYIYSFTTLEGPKNPTNGLYAYYTFENNTTNTVSGAPNASGINTSYVDGVQGGIALQFSSSKSRLNISEAIIDNGTFSTAFWIKDCSDGHIFSVRTSDSDYEYAFVFSIRDGMFTFVPGTFYYHKYYFSDYGLTPSFEHSDLNASKWYHLALTSQYNSVSGKLSVKFYVDGEPVDAITCSTYGGRDINKGVKLLFGGTLTTQNYMFDMSLNWMNMSLDNVRIYKNKVLSDDEVQQIYEYEKQ